MPATLRAFPPPARRCRGAPERRAPSWRALGTQWLRHCEKLAAWKLLAPSPPLRGGEGWGEGALFTPLCGGESGTIRPRSGHRHGCRCLFVRTGVRSKSPAPAHGLAGHRPASAKRGGLLFGHFLLATQEKVARALQGVRKLLLRTHHQEQEHRAQGALLQKSNSKGIATEVAPTSEGGRCAGATGLCSWLPLPRFAGERVGERGRFSLPCAAVSRGRQGRAAGIDMDVDAFSLGQDARSKSPAPAHGLAGRKPGKRQAGWPSLWLLSLTPGILPYALRASFAVRTRSRRVRGHPRESSSRSAGVRKLLLRTHHQEQEHRAQGALLQKSKSIATEVAPT